jgi:hypothetical protein
VVSTETAESAVVLVSSHMVCLNIGKEDRVESDKLVGAIEEKDEQDLASLVVWE